MLRRLIKVLGKLIFLMLVAAACASPASVTDPSQVVEGGGASPLAGTPPQRAREVSGVEVGSPVASPQPPEILELTPTPQPSPSATGTAPSPTAESVNPLTGLPVSDPSLLERRPVMIKVSNYPASQRPHSGLSYADLVFSYDIGVGMTRYLALYYGRDAQFVGPVRSGRLIDPQLTLMYGGLLGMVGADRYVWGVIQDALPGRFISQRPITCPALCREEESGQVFADTAAFTEYVQQLGLDNERPSIEGLRFDEEPAFRGEEATKLWIYYSYYNQVEWTYSSEQGVFLRSQEVAQEDKTVLIEPMTDRLTGEQLAFNNVVVLFAPHHEMQPELIEIDLWGADMQRAIMFRDGMIYEAFYSAISSTRPLRFYTSEGDLFTLKPGATWFEIVGLGSALEEVAPGSWKLRFYR